MAASRSILFLAALLAAGSGAQAAERGAVTQTFQVSANGSGSWRIDGQLNPPLTLQRGGTYVFHLNAVGQTHPFNINTIDAPGPNFRYENGVTNNGATGTTDIVFVVPAEAPDVLHYNCEHHVPMNGPIAITAADPIFADDFEGA